MKLSDPANMILLILSIYSEISSTTTSVTAKVFES